MNHLDDVGTTITEKFFAPLRITQLEAPGKVSMRSGVGRIC